VVTDPNSELLTQLTRIADALGRSAASPWTEWVRTLASFIGGMGASYFTITMQKRSGERHAQAKMRRIVYRELTASIVTLYVIVQHLEKDPADTSWVRHALGDIPFAFDGEDYMRENRDVAYGLAEIVTLHTMYSRFREASEYKQVSLNAYKFTLSLVAGAFKHDREIRNHFKKFGGPDYPLIERVANEFADYAFTSETGDLPDGKESEGKRQAAGA
jgi:hypothetical protein